MAKVILRQETIDDLTAIWDYTLQEQSRNKPNLTIGFHGCDEIVRNELANNPNTVKRNQETYDQFGNGFYLWENNYERASTFAIVHHFKIIYL